MHIPKQVSHIINKLESNGYEAYIVGGCVRDSLIGRVPHDWDICTSALPDEILKVFNGYRIIETGIKHGTVTIMIDYEPFEITTFRVDGEYSDGRRPDSVRFTTSLEEDLARRDFTINAMAYNKEKGLIDPFRGQADLFNGYLRCVGDPSFRFKEDGLRILRAIRFSITYKLIITKETYYSMQLHRGMLANISKERITAELEKMLTYPNSNVRNIFRGSSDIIATIIPELRECVGFNQNNKYHEHTVYEHMLYVTDYCNTNDFVIKMAALLHDIGKPQTYSEDADGHGHFYGHPEVSCEIAKHVLCNRLRVTNEQYDEILTLVRYHDMTLAPTRKAVKRALNKMGESTLRKWLVLKLADRLDHLGFYDEQIRNDLVEIGGLIDDIIKSNDCFSIKNLAINGNDLMSIGYKQGKNLGETLKYLLELVLNEKVTNDKESLLEVAQSKLL